MSRKKLASEMLKTALGRLPGMKAIDPKLDLGNGLTVPDYENRIDSFQAKLEDYNQRLADLDAFRSQLKAEERDLGRYSTKMLMAVACTYGRDSYEYQKAGGVRLSDRRWPRRSSSDGEMEGAMA
ncbi:MAG: hypothetical protein AAFY78_20390 [Cyanobacteria bacterium J06648_16]